MQNDGIKSIEQFHGPSGMNLRDWFAGQAISGIGIEAARLDSIVLKRIVKSAYEFADAMLREREK